MRDDGRDGCLKILGLGPTASAQEIKDAYRDLAKVWHPDRFAHDPRLQQKAQEQLKEINEAYARLVSGDFAKPHARTRPGAHAAHTPRPARDAYTPPRATRSEAARGGSPEARTTADERVATRPRRKVNRIAIAAPALAFCATFAFFTPRLLSTARAPEQTGEATAAAPTHNEHNEPPSQPADSAAETAEAKDARARQKNQTTTQQRPNGVESSAPAAAAQPVRAMPTVTVSIDPTTGLRARPDCPNKSAMTFPAGDEPGAYCNAAHGTPKPQRAAPEEERAGERDGSRLKSFAGRISSPAKKLFGGRGSSGKEPAREKNDSHD